MAGFVTVTDQNGIRLTINGDFIKYLYFEGYFNTVEPFEDVLKVMVRAKFKQIYNEQP